MLWSVCNLWMTNKRAIFTTTQPARISPEGVNYPFLLPIPSLSPSFLTYILSLPLPSPLSLLSLPSPTSPLPSSLTFSLSLSLPLSLSSPSLPLPLPSLPHLPSPPSSLPLLLSTTPSSPWSTTSIHFLVGDLKCMHAIATKPRCLATGKGPTYLYTPHQPTSGY